MRSRNLVFIVVLFGSFLAGHFTAAHQAQALDAKRTGMVSDERAGVLRFLIDGKEVARIDARGLDVREDISYGGSIVDYGQAEFDRRSAEAGDGK